MKGVFPVRREPLDLKAVQKGLLAFLSIMVGVLAVGLVGVMLSDAADFRGEYFINGLMLVSLFCGGAVAGKQAAAGGWRHGIITGAVGGLLVLALALMMAPELFNWYEAVIKCLLLIAAGAAGGVVGVNLPPVARRRHQKQRYYG